MRVLPLSIILNKENIPNKRFFFISGNELTLMEKIKSLIVNKYQKQEVSQITNISTIKEFVDEVGLFENKKIYLVRSIKGLDQRCFDNVKKSLSIFIFIQENSQNVKKVKNFFNKDENCCLIDCYELNKESRMKILNKFVVDNKLNISKDVYWLLIEKLEVEYLFFETSLNKILELKEEEITVDNIKKILTIDIGNKEKVFFNLLKNNREIVEIYRDKILNISDVYDLYYHSKFLCQLIIETNNLNEYQKKIPLYLFKEKNFLIEVYNKYNLKKKKMLINLLASTEKVLRKESGLSMVSGLRFLLSIKKITIS